MFPSTHTVSEALDTAKGWLLERATPTIIKTKLWAVASMLMVKPTLKHHLGDIRASGVPIDYDFKLQYLTWDRSTGIHVIIEGGRMRVGSGPLPSADVTARFKTLEAMRDFFDPDVNHLDLIVNNDVALEGNMTALSKFGHMANCVSLGDKKLPLHPDWVKGFGPARWQDMDAYPTGESCDNRPEDEVTHLTDPFLAEYSLDDLPRIKKQLWEYRTTVPEVCTERAKLYTDFKVAGGGSSSDDETPALREARAFRYVMSRKEPIIRDDDILAGTTTTRQLGVRFNPERGGTWRWWELLRSGARELNP